MSKQESQTSPGISHRQTTILLAVVLLNIVLYGALWMLSRGSETQERPVVQVSSSGESIALETAFQKAQVAARGWQADAQITGATTSWQVASGDKLTLQRTDWSFSFYSPAAGRVQLVTVNNQGAQSTRQQPVRVPPQPVMPDWTLDSDDLLLTFLGKGGQDFINAHPRANIHLQLKTDEAGRAIWYVTAVDPVGRQTFNLEIDAQSREIVQSENNAGGG
jgi:hypothetical protein